MNGRQHGWTGVAVGLYTIGIGAAVGLPVPPAPIHVAAATGSSILPDADHVNASIAHMWGPASKPISWVVNRATGGHRGATHGWVIGPLLGIALLAVGALHPLLGAAVWTFLAGATIAVFDKLLPIHVGPTGNLAASAVVGLIAWIYAWPTLSLIVPVAIGIITHRIGDTIQEDSTRATATVYACMAATALWAAAVHLTNLRSVA